MGKFSKVLSINKMKIVLYVTGICFLLQDAIEAYSMRINRNNEQNNARKAEKGTFGLVNKQ
jgi:hypothetical protein